MSIETTVFAVGIVEAFAPAGVVETATQKTHELLTFVQILGGLIGVIVVVVSSIRSGFTLKGVISGIVVGGLIAWGVIGGTQFFKTQIGGEFEAAGPAVVKVAAEA